VGEIHQIKFVKPVCSVTLTRSVLLDDVLVQLESVLGTVQDRSPVFDFSFTNYYQKEMGEDLRKVFLSFTGLMHPGKLSEIKLRTNEIEKMWITDNRREVNLDPGYITGAKLVLASTKNFAHRIFLEDGIYGDVQLRFIKKYFRASEWTYPDYKTELAIKFFHRVRLCYIQEEKSMAKPIRYKDAGVDITAGEEAVHRIKDLVRSTFTPQVLTDLGKFGGFFAPNLKSFHDPVLVSSIDGVGTKIKVAVLAGKHDSIGEDLVNHCVNDILVGGARPLFFLDYIGTGRLKSAVIEHIISGMVRACRCVNCALIGGEMAEMPGFYNEGEYDFAGSIVGIVEKGRIIDGRNICKGDILLGLPSNGLHTNGYSLARKILLDEAGLNINSYIKEVDKTLGEELLRVHRCYYEPVYSILEKVEIKGMSHITGGGIVGNTRRILPVGLDLKVDWGSWMVPPIFNLISKKGDVPEDDIRKTFNLGIGFILIVEEKKAELLFEMLKDKGEEPAIIGTVV